MSSKGMRLVLCLLLSGVVSTGVGLAADVTPQVYVDFLGKLEGKAYKLGARELDKTKSFAAHHGTEIVENGLGTLTDADQASQESFEFDASAFSHNATTFAGVPFVVEAVFTPTGGSDSMAPIIDIGGQAFIRFQTGLSAGSWNGSTDSVNNNIRTIPAAGEKHHYAMVYDGANLIDYYLDGVAIFQSTNGSPQQITKWISWGNIRHSSVDGTRQLIGEYDAVAFSTFSGAFDPAKDFILPKGLGSAGAAFEPVPAVDATDVPLDAMLSWTPGMYAATHDVYAGTSFADVNSASRAEPKGVQVAQDLPEVGYNGEGLLEFGKTYYWRVDEVNAAPDSTIYKGEVWSFTAEPFSYPIENIKATASSVGRADTGAQNTVNGSGLTADDRHSVDAKDMWLSGNTKPHWIQYEFDRVYKLDELWVWNANQIMETFIGFGAKDVTIAYSADGQTWATLGDTYEFAKAPGDVTCTANTIVDFGGVEAKFVKLTINSNWGGMAQQVSLSEVRFFYVPVQAREPQPADGATGVALDASMNWRPGREATWHQVYFGTDSAAVAAGTVAPETANRHSYTPASMTFGTKYFWKVDEMADNDGYAGDVWSFTSLEFAPLDDFEAYTDDEGSRIYQAWTDGVTDAANGGSTVGYMTAPFAEKVILHGGKQSMPLAYDNTKAPFFSQATKEFETPVNCTGSGAAELCVWTRGYPAVTTTEVAESGGKISVTGAGADIWENSDECTFAYRTLTGDGTLVARVASFGTGTNTWAKGGVMIRDSVNGGSTMAIMAMTGGGGNGASFQYRGTANSGCGNSDSTAAVKPPYWVKIERAGDLFTGYTSADGKAWLQTGTTVITMADPVLIGLAVTSHVTTEQRTFEFESISSTGNVTGNWQGAVINTAQYNAAAPMFLTVTDGAGKSATAVSDTAATVADWTRWTIPMNSLSGVSLSKVKKLTIGVGAKDATSGGSGLVFIDDIGFGRSAQ
jgi:hypothetical protein